MQPRPVLALYLRRHFGHVGPERLLDRVAPPGEFRPILLAVGRRGVDERVAQVDGAEQHVSAHFRERLLTAHVLLVHRGHALLDVLQAAPQLVAPEKPEGEDDGEAGGERNTGARGPAV